MLLPGCSEKETKKEKLPLGPAVCLVLPTRVLGACAVIYDSQRSLHVRAASVAAQSTPDV